MNTRSISRILARALLFGFVAASGGATVLGGPAGFGPASAEAVPSTPRSSDHDDHDDFDEDEDSEEDGPPTDDNGDGPLQRYICHLGVGRWVAPLADAITEYVWATDFEEADRKARDDHPMTPPFNYIAWSRCDPA